MRETEFMQWMIGVRKLDETTSRTRMANCRKVEQYEGNLDEHYSVDGLEGLVARLMYTIADWRAGVAPKHRIPFAEGANVYNGTATLRTAVSLYKKFRDGSLEAKTPRSASSRGSARARSGASAKSASGLRGGRYPWPEWDQPSDDDAWILAQSETRFARFLDPRIVEAIVRDNARNAPGWREALKERGVRPDYYLWDGSPCAFPGVRRTTGSKEVSRLWDGSLRGGTLQVADAIAVDDNSFPKHVWSITLRGKPFQNFGPVGYQLAHIVDHKLKGNRMRDELDVDESCDFDYVPGLYTCPTNTAYVPNMLIRPTDFNVKIRELFLRKAYELYGDVCNLFPEGLRIPEEPDCGWSVQDFEWPECVGEYAMAGEFLRYRERELSKLIHATKSTGDAECEVE